MAGDLSGCTGTRTFDWRPAQVLSLGQWRVASGERTKSELHGYGQNEFVPWPLGAVT